MLPKIVRLKSGLSGRGRMSLALLGVAILALPTWQQQAQSQFGGNTGKTVDNSTDKTAAGKNAATSQPASRITAVNRPALPAMAPPSVEYLPEPADAEQTILGKLDDQVTFDFVDESLDGVRHHLMDKQQLNVVIDKVHLEEESIASDANDINLKVSGISLRSALKLLLAAKNCAFVVEHEVLKVTTKTIAVDAMQTRTYPVRDLVGNVDADYVLLMKAIQEGVGQPEQQWVEADGEGGTISMLPATGCLVIRQNWQGHGEILKLLRSLRRANDEMKVKQ